MDFSSPQSSLPTVPPDLTRIGDGWPCRRVYVLFIGTNYDLERWPRSHPWEARPRSDRGEGHFAEGGELHTLDFSGHLRQLQFRTDTHSSSSLFRSSSMPAFRNSSISVEVIS